jgi:PAS domain S-box-containing protein
MVNDLEQRILVLAPTAKDSDLTQSILSASGISCDICSSVSDLIVKSEQGVGALLVAEEVLSNSKDEQLKTLIDRQAAWSDLPVILVTRQGIDSPAIGRAISSLGNVILVERPTRVIGLTNAVRNALRARSRQYQARDVLVQYERIAQALRESEQRYRTLVEQVKDYAIFMIDLNGLATSWNEGVSRVLGFSEVEFLGLDIARTIFTPEDQFNEVPLRELEEATRFGSASNDRWMKRKDGGHFWASGITSALYGPRGEHIGYTKVMRDLTASKEAEDALKQADRRKDEFLATLAHELRNPLAPIRNSLYILREAGSRDPDTATICAMLDRQVNHLVRLVDDLLEVSRITRGKIELRQEQIDLASLVHSAVETSRPLIESAKHNLRVTLPSETIVLWGDPVRLGQVFSNLLNNAAKYTNEGGTIWLTAKRVGDKVEVSVRDNGIGIPQEMLPNVFEMFMQVDRTIKKAQGGLGIGLTLVKSLVELHGGTITVHSGQAGDGSEFIVRLPLRTRLNEKRKSKVESTYTKCDGLKGCRVLVVDDNVDAATSLRILLKVKGADVQVAHSGPAALEIIEESSPEVVLLDIGMPGMDGYEVAQRVRENPANGDILLIALTGWGQEEDRQKTRQAGFNHHLVKPANITDIEELLSKR